MFRKKSKENINIQSQSADDDKKEKTELQKSIEKYYTCFEDISAKTAEIVGPILEEVRKLEEKTQQLKKIAHNILLSHYRIGFNKHGKQIHIFAERKDPLFTDTSLVSNKESELHKNIKKLPISTQELCDFLDGIREIRDNQCHITDDVFKDRTVNREKFEDILVGSIDLATKLIEENIRKINENSNKNTIDYLKSQIEILSKDKIGLKNILNESLDTPYKDRIPGKFKPVQEMSEKEWDIKKDEILSEIDKNQEE